MKVQQRGRNETESVNLNSFKMQNKFKFFTLIILGLLIVACGKDALLSDKPTTEQSKIAVKQHFNDLNTVNALVNLQGGNIDEVLEQIEDALNESHAYPDQSIGEISVSETEFTVPNNCTDIEAAAIYENALSLWSDTYQNFDGENPQAILIDLEKLEEPAENGDTRVKVSALVGEAQENEALSPCDNVTFPTGTYEFKKPSTNPSITKKYAGDKMTGKLSTKLNNNPCLYYTKTKDFPLSALQNTLFTGKATLNNTEMEDFYCQILALLQSLNLPAGYAIQSVVVNSDIAIVGNKSNGAFLISVKIGIPKYRKPPCYVVPPPDK